MSKQNKKPQDNMEFILHWPTISRHGPVPECGLTPIDSPLEKTHFHFQADINCK